MPAVWVIQAEAQFHLAGVTPLLTRFYYATSVLTPDLAKEVYDILANPSATAPYSRRKTALLQYTIPSNRSRFQLLLSAQELNDRRLMVDKSAVRPILVHGIVACGSTRRSYLEMLDPIEGVNDLLNQPPPLLLPPES